MRVINLKTNHLTEPVGIDAGALFLSWQCADGVRQTAYEIELTANGETVWHSGKVQSTAMHARCHDCGRLARARMLARAPVGRKRYLRRVECGAL